jgi:putative Mg2+ transporter-C (MgtC) family protein
MDWLIETAMQWIGPALPNVALALTSIACGAIVGAEREAKEKTAGLRTIILVTLGAAVFTRISIVVGAEHGEPTRIAAQIVTGIGFLGAGTIMRSAGGIRGITTAATIWSIAAVGVVVGSGYAVAGLALSVGILMILTMVNSLENRYLGPCRRQSARISFTPEGGKAAVRIEEILDAYQIPDAARHHETLPGDRREIRFAYCNAHKHHREFLTQLANLPEVLEIDRSDLPW